MNYLLPVKRKTLDVAPHPCALFSVAGWCSEEKENKQHKLFCITVGL